MTHDPIRNLYDQFTPTERLKLTLEAMASGRLPEAERLIEACPRRAYTGNDTAFTLRMDLAFKLALLASIDLRWLWGQILALRGAMHTIEPLNTLHLINVQLAFLEGIGCSQGRPQSPFYAHSGSAEQSPGSKDDAPAAAHVSSSGHGEESTCDLSVLGDDFERRATAVEQKSEKATTLTTTLLQRAVDQLLIELVEVWTALERFCGKQVGVEPRTLLRSSGFSDVELLEQEIAAAAHLTPCQAEVDGYYTMMAGVWNRAFLNEAEDDHGA